MKGARSLNAATTVRLVGASLLTLNFADFITTYVAISSGKGAEANPFFSFLGGPLSPASVAMKLVAIPSLVATVTWWGSRKVENRNLSLIMLLPVAASFGVAVANNVIVMVKKSWKNVKRENRKVGKKLVKDAADKSR